MFTNMNECIHEHGERYILLQMDKSEKGIITSSIASKCIWVIHLVDPMWPKGHWSPAPRHTFCTINNANFAYFMTTRSFFWGRLQQVQTKPITLAHFVTTIFTWSPWSTGKRILHPPPSPMDQLLITIRGLIKPLIQTRRITCRLAHFHTHVWMITSCNSSRHTFWTIFSIIIYKTFGWRKTWMQCTWKTKFSGVTNWSQLPKCNLWSS